MGTSYDPNNYGNAPDSGGPLRPGGRPGSVGTGDDDKNLPSYECPAYKAQLPALTLVRDISGGTETVRMKGTMYLPQAPGEDAKNYNARLFRSVFFNVFGKTVDGLTGFVMAKDPVLGDDVPLEIKGVEATDSTEKQSGHWENIDNAGTHGDVFVRDLFQDALTAGHAAILVDFPNTGGVQSAADESGDYPIRPYWVPLKKDNIINWHTEVINGRTVLTLVVLRECTYVQDGAFGKKEQKRYRVFYNNGGLVTFQLFEIAEDKKTPVLVDFGSYPTQDEIPIAEVVTSGRKGVFESCPPLLDLAYLNVAHYQQWSDYAYSQYKTCVPILGLYGFSTPDGKEIDSLVVGPNTVLISSNPQAHADYTSHDGAALGACKQSLDDLKSDMSVLGLSMLAPQKRAAETAEAKRIDKAGSDSELGVAARGLQDGVERALYIHARYLNLDSGGSIEINRDFDIRGPDAGLIGAYADLAVKLSVPARFVLEQLQRLGAIPDGEDLDKLEGDMAAEAAAKAEMARVEAANALAVAQEKGGQQPGQQPPGLAA